MGGVIPLEAGWIGVVVPWSGGAAVSQSWDDGQFAGLEA